MLDILVIVLLTLLEGFFVAAEIALVSIRRSRVEQLVDEGSSGAPPRPAPARASPAGSWRSSQLGLTFIGFFASAYAAVSLVRRSRERSSRASGIDPGDSRDDRPDHRHGRARPVHDHLRRARARRRLALANTERFALVLSLPIDFLARALGPLDRGS